MACAGCFRPKPGSPAPTAPAKPTLGCVQPGTHGGKVGEYRRKDNTTVTLCDLHLRGAANIAGKA
jgi:hypothetical protein